MTRKLYQRRGESFIETIAAMLIISLGMLMLAGSIISAARVNKRAENETIQVVPPPLPTTLPPATGWSPDRNDGWWKKDGERWQVSDGWFVHVSNPNSGEPNDPETSNNPNNLPVTLYKAVPEGGEGDEEQVLYYYTAS